ncbi:hypothetical protein CUJ88_48560 (plasmid) [Paraburkholderia hospita]|nr:hypothetical protein CUJ88_48560 [Paraburkholderia hospita]OUL73963.1 hypothetical protein CA601_43275 [Paraburkholderia hospita]
MTSYGRSRIDRAVVQAEMDYQLELSRGASVIASMLSAENVAAAVGETLTAFESAYGTTELQIFIQLLGQRLVNRDRSDAANMLVTWNPSSCAPHVADVTGRHRKPSR